MKDKNFSKGRDCVKLLAQLEEAFQKYEQAVLDLLSTITTTSDQHLDYSNQLAAARTEHFIFVANKNTKMTQNCTMINSNGRLRRDQWSSSQAATQANILIQFKILQ